MRGKFFKYFLYRNFSNSKILRNIEKEKPTEAKPSLTDQDYKITFSPSSFDKKVLVWSGKFKSVEDIPSRLSLQTIDNARSIFRIKFGTILMIGTIFMCGFYVWLGKKRAREGDSINKRAAERDAQILEKYRSSL